VPVEEVFEEFEVVAEVDLNPEVIAVVTEKALLRCHKILMANDSAGTVFYRETYSYEDDETPIELLGPFGSAEAAAYGVSLV